MSKADTAFGILEGSLEEIALGLLKSQVLNAVLVLPPDRAGGQFGQSADEVRIDLLLPFRR
jgi:hypothetical protein